MAAGAAEAVKPFPNPRDHPRVGQVDEAAAEAVVGPLVVQGAAQVEQRHRPLNTLSRNPHDRPC